jgi:hypothetical protein
VEKISLMFIAFVQLFSAESQDKIKTDSTGTLPPSLVALKINLLLTFA